MFAGLFHQTVSEVQQDFSDTTTANQYDGGICIADCDDAAGTRILCQRLG